MKGNLHCVLEITEMMVSASGKASRVPQLTIAERYYAL